MSLHRSLKSKIDKHKRSVRKRYERLRSLILQEKWDREHSDIYALPKEKIVRLKIKKIKEEKEKPIENLAIYAKEVEKKIKKKSKDVGKIR